MSENRRMGKYDISRNSYVHTCFITPKFKHSHDFFELSFCLHGKSINVVNGKPFLFSRGTLAIIRPTDNHFFKETPTKKGKLAYAHKDIYAKHDLFRKICDTMHHDLYDKIMANPSPIVFTIPEETFSFLLRQSLLLEEAVVTKNDFFEVIHSSLISLILSQWIEKNVCFSSSFPAWLVDILPLFNLPEVLSMNITKIAEMTGYTLPHFSAEFKKHMKTSPVKYLIKKRLDFSTSLLIENKLKIIDIAGLIGFTNPSTYCQHFYKEYGVTPNEYRRQRVSQKTSTV